MTKLVKKLLISLMAIVMTACLGLALLGTQPITADAATAEYGLWVGGVKVTSDNLVIDGNDNSAITGTATYDAENKTLTLDNFVYSGAGYLYDIANDSEYSEYYHNYAGIYSKGDLNIALNGENTLNCAITDEDSDNIYKSCDGISVDGALTISDGTLNATIVGNVIVANTLTIDNATLNSNSTYVNIFLNGDAIISNSKVFAKGGSPVIAIGYGYELKITNSTVVIQSEDSSYGICYPSVINIDKKSVLEISVSNCAIENTITVNYSQNSSVYAGENKENAQLVAEPDNTTFASKYVKIVPKVKVTVNFGTSELANKEISIEKGETLSLETPVIDGYIFIGWYNEDTLETAFDFSTPINDNITLYAKFANYTQDIANINSQINGVKDSITSLQSSIDGKADATELANNVTDLQGKIDALTNNYQSADATQQAEIDTLKQQVSTLINDTIVLLNSKVTDIESEIADIKTDITTNAGNITANADKITSLTTQLTALQGLVNNLGDTYIDNTELNSLKAELVDADNQIKGLITALTAKVTDIESEIANINSAISTNAGDITANADKITSLTTNLTALQSVVNSLGDTYIDNTELNSLKAELVDADNQIKGLIETLTAKVTDIETEIANINNAISSNESDIIKNADKITSLTTQLTALQGVVNSLGDTYIDNTELASLKDALELADKGLNDLITALTTRVDKTESDIATLISSKADVTFVNEKISELKGLINALDAVKNNYKTADTELKQDLESQIADAKTYALNTATTLVNNAKTELNSAIALKADTATLNEKVTMLTNAIATAENLAKEYTDGKVAELTTAIATAKDEAITSAENLVNTAKAELNSAIALKADTATVTAKFNEVESAIDILQELSDDYLSADSALKEELTTLITNTKAEIIELIIAGDKANADALEEEIAKLRAEIEALKKATNEDIKEAESNAKVLPTVIASVAVLGDIALLVWLIIKRKIVK